jgi:hypothetical protein
VNASPVFLRIRRTVIVVAGIVLLSGPSRVSAGAESPSPIAIPGEVHEMLGEGVVTALEPGAPETARPLSDPLSVARWEPGEWTYQITSGARRGTTLRETLAPIDATRRSETWKRTIGEDYTLYVSRTAEGSLVLASEFAHAHKALVYFDPPLSYLITALEPGGTRVVDGRMDVYRATNPDRKLYSGRIRATTMHAGMYRIKTPAGTFSATLIKTDYAIDIFAIVSVRDTLYTFYAEGIGKVAEAEHQRTSLMGPFHTNTQIGKVLVSFPRIGGRSVLAESAEAGRGETRGARP